MMATLIDTLQIAKKAKEAGFSEKQAEFYAENLAGVLDSQVATKQDIKELRQEIKDLRYELKEFMVRVAIGIVSILGGLLALFHFVK